MQEFGVSKYKAAKTLLESIDEGTEKSIRDLQADIEERLASADDRTRKATEGSVSIAKAAKSSIRLGELDPLEELERQERMVDHAMSGNRNFVRVYANLSRAISFGWEILRSVVSSISSEELFKIEEDASGSRERMQDLSAEYQLNRNACERFFTGCMTLGSYHHNLLNMVNDFTAVADEYSNALRERHSERGVKVHHAPILTDFAIVIYENIAHHGELSDSSTDTEMSAYSLRKAAAIVEWITDEELKDVLLGDANLFTQKFKGELFQLWKMATSLDELIKDQIDSVYALAYKRRVKVSRRQFDNAIDMFSDADPNTLTFKDKSASLTEEERRNLQDKNVAIGKICRMLRDGESPAVISTSVWEDVKKLKKHQMEVNSFYVCQIGQGSPLGQKSHGQLEVVPGKKPTAKFDDIIGSGFVEVKEFVAHVARLRKWAPLYRITSPRKQADKSNILMVGPMGCGKTECMRAICNEEDCIAIFAAGSDFLTAWMGEAQKNPKRLFEAAVKLQKDSGRHVHILIDEIDEVLNNDRSTTSINLSLEFQMIMDGIVEYPNISVWGATNNAERIPMPMIRRFSKVVIVGKLDLEHRVTLLKQFLGTMPLSDEFTDEVWDGFGERLEHATGDVVRKVCDHVWRTEISRFIEEDPEEAERMLRVLENLSYDKKTYVVPDVLETQTADEEIDERRLGGEVTSRRKKFLKSLEPIFKVEPPIVDEAIELALSNIGIINEIETAKRTYEDSEKFLAEVKKGRMAPPPESAATLVAEEEKSEATA